MTKAVLNSEERERFDALCGTVKRGLTTFVEVGAALLEIRDAKLYRERCSTFEAFVQVEFGLSRASAYRQIAAAEVVSEMSQIETKPTNADQAIALGALPPEERPKAWTEAVKDAAEAGVKVTAAAVRKAVNRVKHPKHESAEDMAAAIVGRIEPKPEPAKPTEHEPDPIAEWQRSEDECVRLRALVDSLKAGKVEAEYVTLSERYARLNGRLQQEIATHTEAVKEAKYAKAQLAKIRLALGVQTDAAILPAIKALQS